MSNPSPDNAAPPSQGKKERTIPFSGWWPFVAGALTGIALRLVFSGAPGSAFAAMTAGFIYLVPFLVGAVTVYVAERQKRRDWGYYMASGLLATVLFVVGTMVI